MNTLDNISLRVANKLAFRNNKEYTRAQNALLSFMEGNPQNVHYCNAGVDGMTDIGLTLTRGESNFIQEVVSVITSAANRLPQNLFRRTFFQELLKVNPQTNPQVVAEKAKKLYNQLIREGILA